MLKLIPVLVVAMLPVLASCSADTASTASGPCKADATQSLIGKPKPTDAEAMRVTNSRTVRQIELGQGVTHDFREDRVTVETDATSGRVVGARCG
ncbi:hypothetical protein GR204_33675 [Rhizobium leguminosarum]|uniref:Peptidase inhibitor I78 family protein n=1 Tax=Rhizobium leguminosarum TaxID=384 RepID=A0A6P0BJD8_RHILE|nr:hypothetical protein [Rhizobium leguminosarum]NEI45856.1 hypothetical protein [Rhizobium leguminosarum]